MLCRLAPSLLAVLLAAPFPLRAAAPLPVPPRAVLAAAPRFVTVAPGEAMAVWEMAGSGPTLVIIPGLLGGAFAYRKVLPPLAQARLRVVIVEPLGLGSSAAPETADYSLTAQARRVGAVLDTLGITQARVAGHVLGAAIAFRLAVARPALVTMLLALDGGANERAGTPGLVRGLKLGGMVARFGGGEIVKSRLKQELEENAHDDSWITRDVLDRYVGGRTRDVGAALATFRRIADAPEPEAITPKLATLGMPVRIVVGAEPHSGGINEGEIRLLQERVKHAQVIRVPNGGLWLQEETPAALAAVLAAD